jgi:hypothetical protein
MMTTYSTLFTRCSRASWGAVSAIAFLLVASTSACKTTAGTAAVVVAQPRLAQANLVTDPSPSPTVDAAEPHRALVIPLQDLGISLAVPSGWVAVGDEELVSNLKRLDDRQRGLEMAVSSMQARRNVPLLALRKAVIHGTEDRITVLIQVVDVPAGSDPLTLLAERKPGLQKTFEKFVVVEDVHAIARDGVRGAEFTEEHDLPLRDGAKEHMGITRQFFVRGGHVFLLSVTWIGQGATRPPEVAPMLEILTFQAERGPV